MERLLWIALGGGLGSLLRYGLVRCFQASDSTGFPLGTLLVNLLGSFALGWLLALGPGPQWLTPNVRLGLGTGLLGGFTTYSAFSWEVVQLHGSGLPWQSALYLGGTLLGCLVATWAGLALGRPADAP